MLGPLKEIKHVSAEIKRNTIWQVVFYVLVCLHAKNESRQGLYNETAHRSFPVTFDFPLAIEASSDRLSAFFKVIKNSDLAAASIRLSISLLMYLVS